MSYLRKLAFAGAAALALAPTLAKAADMPMPPAPEPIVEFGGWYLRGDIGMSNQYVKRLDSPAFTPDVTVLAKGFDSAPTFGVGIGYQFNSWLRVDLTTEYRGGSTFRGMDRYLDPTIIPGGIGTNDYHGTKTEWLTLFNGYLDLGTWYSLTPYVGAGIGVTRNTISNWRDNNIVTAASAYANSHSEWDLAWAALRGACPTGHAEFPDRLRLSLHQSR